MWANDTSIIVYDASATYSPSFTGYITIETWGAGGGGGSQNLASDGGGGGGGGAYAKLNSFYVVNGSSYTILVGNGGASIAGGAGTSGTGGSGTWSLFRSGATNICYADGGVGGLRSGGSPPNGVRGGLDSSSLGDVKYSGGFGSPGRDSNTGIGGGGGSSAGIDASGYARTSLAAASYQQAGFTAPTQGGNGGAGGSSGAAGVVGTQPGGGGGGTGETTSAAILSGAGANGRIRLTQNIQFWISDVIIV